MAWSGLVQAAALAERGVVDGSATRWRGRRRRDQRTPCSRGGGALTLTDTGGGPDAALAQAATVGFLDRDDPRLHATLDSITGALDRGGLVDRHLAEEDASDEDRAARSCSPPSGSRRRWSGAGATGPDTSRPRRPRAARSTSSGRSPTRATARRSATTRRCRATPASCWPPPNRRPRL